MTREQVVTNGCSGACCTCFTLPVTMRDLAAMQQAYKDGVDRIICENGKERSLPPEDELNFIANMLIPLGQTETDPQGGANFSEQYKSLREHDGTWSKILLTLKLHDHFMVIHDKLVANIYTCKHFDTENKICTVYERRPFICREFGKTCNYAGCTYKAQARAADNANYLEALATVDTGKAPEKKEN